MNNPISIISAGAGSGKTYRLTELLEKSILDGSVRPEGVMATTFTKPAAAELQERVRTRLLRSGQNAAAQRLTAARIGTVHSICGRLISDYAFDLGLSPRLATLDEETAAAVLRSSMAEILTNEEERELHQLSERMVEFKWQREVQTVMTLARSNGLQAAQLEECAQKSLKSVQALLGETAGDAEVLDLQLRSSLEGLYQDLNARVPAFKLPKDLAKAADDALRRCNAGLPVPWKDWAGLAKCDVPKKDGALRAAVQKAAAKYDQHPRMASDISRAITLVFSIAGRSLNAYQSRKQMMGALDFTDQETMALELLKRPQVIAQLREELDLVLVDEFQDTNPIQLAIFLRLSAAAKKSIWVGDQKQSIYAFRGSDPALMNAAIDVILQKSEPETLNQSYRSRAELVDLTSDLFAPAFERQDIPAGRTRLSAAHSCNDVALGEVLECWTLQSTNAGNDPAALAHGVAQLLGDQVQVRGLDQHPRQLRAGDIAVLCRINDTCSKVAEALGALGIRAVLPRSGLLARLESRALLAGLRYWVDEKNALASAELARLLSYSGREDEWFSQLLEAPEAKAFAAIPLQQAIAASRNSTLGAVAVFDAVIEALALGDVCCRWGDAPQRLANLEALRAHCVIYAQNCAKQGSASTPAEMIAYLEALAQEDTDTQGLSPDTDAVTIMTWHKAKGLEWPVTILMGLGTHDRATAALGVKIVQDTPKINLENPLSGRWIRYWPNPFHSSNTKTPFHQRLADHPATQYAQEQAKREDLRLLYVGWTRARDRLILPARPGKLTDGLLELLQDSSGPLVIEPEPGSKEIQMAGRAIRMRSRILEPQSPVVRSVTPGELYVRRGQQFHPPAFIQPSSLTSVASCGEAIRINDRMIMYGNGEWANVGQALHGFFSVDRTGRAEPERLAIATDCLARWGVDGIFRASDLLRVSDGFTAWVTSRWPDARWHREWPVQQILVGGTRLRGSSDLVLELQDGFLVIDHKSYPGTLAEATQRAMGHCGQLHGYAHAIASATSKPILGMFVHMPVLGVVIPLGL